MYREVKMRKEGDDRGAHRSGGNRTLKRLAAALILAFRRGGGVGPPPQGSLVAAIDRCLADPALPENFESRESGD
jgi:hypothetical protein